MSRRVAVVIVVGVLGVVVGVVVGLLAGRALPTGETAAPPPGPSAADIGFCQDMATHHEQAIEMATLAAGRGTPALQALATTIQLSQARESGSMRGWLQLWNAPQLPSAAPMSWMQHPDGHGDAAPMPGMASRPEIDQLATLHGTDFDVRFLQLMIRHHQGGVIMAQDAQPMLGVPAVHDFALSVVATQSDEIATMTAALIRVGAPLPAPL